MCDRRVLWVTSDMTVNYRLNVSKRDGAMRIVLLLLLLGVAGCTKPTAFYTVKNDVTIHLEAPDACGYCKSARYYPENGNVSELLPIGPRIIEEQDIVYVARGHKPGYEITFAYTSNAERRIHDATKRHVGDVIAILVGDRIVGMAKIVEPFSNGSKIEGIAPDEADYIVREISKGPYAP